MKVKPILHVVALSVVLVGPLVGAREGSRPQATPQSRPADVMVPGPPESVSIDLPAHVFSAFTALARVLDTAGLRYGLEGPATDPAAPPIDLSRVRENTVLLGGRRVGDALDLIIKAVPHYRWAERDGVIVVRSTADGAGILDRQLSQFTLTNASPRAALDELMFAIDPSRPRGVGIQGFGRSGGTGAGVAAMRSGRNVTMSSTGASVQTILNGISRENGELSWTVKYDRAPAAPDTASITFTERGIEMTAVSPYALRTQSVPGVLPANRLPMSSAVTNMIAVYADRAGLRVSIEEAAARPGEQPSMFTQAVAVPPLELPDQPAAAFARILALDSRYEFSEKNGRYHVRPKPGVPGRFTLLDQTVDGFSATNEPASAVIDRAAQMLGTVRPSPALAAAQRAGAPPSPIVLAMARPIDVNLAGTVSVRDILDAIADATGWTWTFRATFIPGRPTSLYIQWRSSSSSPGMARGGTGGIPASVSPGGWSTSTAITATADLTPPAMPTRAPAVTVPTSLDRAVPQMPLEITPGIAAFRQLGSRAVVPMGIEDVPRVRRDDPRYLIRPAPPLVVGPGQFSDALYVLLERLSDFEIVPAEGMVNVVPSSAVRPTDYFMTRALDTFSVTNVGVFRAVGELRRKMDPQFVPADWTGAGTGTLNKPVTVSLKNATPRAILNEIARQHGRLTWTSTFDGAGTIAAWVVTLVPLDNAGPPIALSTSGGALALSRAEPGIAPGARTVTLDLPVTSSSIRNMLTQAGRATGASVGFASVAPAVGSRPTSTEIYNLSGFSMDEVLEKLRQLSSDYVSSVDKGVYHVRLRESPRELTQWLDQRIPRFEYKFENLRDAMQAVATIGALAVPGMRSGGGGAGAAGAAPPNTVITGVTMAPPGSVVGGVVGGTPPGLVSTNPGLDTMTARLQKTLVLSMTNATVREILDEIARQFGSVVWVVEQRMTTGGLPLSLSFSAEGWMVGTSVR